MNKKLLIYFLIMTALAIGLSLLILINPAPTQTFINELISQKAISNKPLIKSENLKLISKETSSSAN